MWPFKKKEISKPVEFREQFLVHYDPKNNVSSSKVRVLANDASFIQFVVHSDYMHNFEYECLDFETKFDADGYSKQLFCIPSSLLINLITLPSK